MNIKRELLQNAIIEAVRENLQLSDLEIDASQIADTAATKMISEIQNVLINDNNDINDFEIVEEIVCIFEKYHIDCGGCHDFG